MCVYAISGGTGAHMADMLADAGLRLPDLTKATQTALHDGLIPAYLRVSNPVDCGGPPVADRRGRKILDAILADKNVDILVVPITGAVATFSEPFTRDVIEVAKTTDEADLRGLGRARRAPTTRTTSGCSTAGCPMFRTFGNCVAAVKAYADYWTFAARYRSPFDDAPTDAAARGEEGAQAARRTASRARRSRSGARSSCSRRTASRRRRTSCARRRPRR